jgi:hypothetical protein
MGACVSRSVGNVQNCFGVTIYLVYQLLCGKRDHRRRIQRDIADDARHQQDAHVGQQQREQLLRHRVFGTPAPHIPTNDAFLLMVNGDATSTSTPTPPSSSSSSITAVAATYDSRAISSDTWTTRIDRSLLGHILSFTSFDFDYTVPGVSLILASPRSTDIVALQVCREWRRIARQYAPITLRLMGVSSTINDRSMLALRWFRGGVRTLIMGWNNEYAAIQIMMNVRHLPLQRLVGYGVISSNDHWHQTTEYNRTPNRMPQYTPTPAGLVRVYNHTPSLSTHSNEVTKKKGGGWAEEIRLHHPFIRHISFLLPFNPSQYQSTRGVTLMPSLLCPCYLNVPFLYHILQAVISWVVTISIIVMVMV